MGRAEVQRRRTARVGDAGREDAYAPLGRATMGKCCVWVCSDVGVGLLGLTSTLMSGLTAAGIPKKPTSATFTAPAPKRATGTAAGAQTAVAPGSAGLRTVLRIRALEGLEVTDGCVHGLRPQNGGDWWQITDADGGVTTPRLLGRHACYCPVTRVLQ